MSRFHNDRATEDLAIYSHGLAFGIFITGAFVHGVMAWFHWRAVREHKAHARYLDAQKAAEQKGGRV
jgi:hypothetical protein